MHPEIDRKLCQNCLGCVDACPNEVIQEIDGVAIVTNEQCAMCQDCVEQCEFGAITFNG